MNPKLFFVVVILILLSPYSYGQYNYNQKLGSLGSIALPGKPEIKTVKGLNIYFTKYHDVVFLAQAEDISGGLRDLFSSNQVDSSYNAFVRGAIGSSKGKLIYRNNILINGSKALEFSYKSSPNGQDLYSYIRIVALNDSLLMTGIIASDSLSHTHPALEGFFKGFKIVDKEELRSKRNEDAGRKIANVIITLMAIGIPIAIGLAIVFIIRRVVYRKKEKRFIRNNHEPTKSSHYNG